MFSAYGIGGAKHIAPVGFHVQEIANAHVRLNPVNNSSCLRDLQDWRATVSKLPQRIRDLDAVPGRPEQRVLAVGLEELSGSLVMRIVEEPERYEKGCVRIDAHRLSFLNRATVSTFFPGLSNS